MDKKQLLLAKYILLRGQDLFSRDDPMSGGLAISLSQDSVEILVWTIAKELEAEVRDKDPFTKLLDSIESAKKNTARPPLPLKAKLLELNSARVNFKHYGNLPAPGSTL